MVDNESCEQICCPNLNCSHCSTLKLCTVKFVEVVDINQVCHQKENNPPESYSQIIGSGMPHLSSLFLEKKDRYSLIKKSVYSRMKKITYFFKENILHPYINMQERKPDLSLRKKLH